MIQNNNLEEKTQEILDTQEGLDNTDLETEDYFELPSFTKNDMAENSFFLELSDIWFNDKFDRSEYAKIVEEPRINDEGDWVYKLEIVDDLTEEEKQSAIKVIISDETD